MATPAARRAARVGRSTGMPVLKKCPQEKPAVYTIVAVVCGIQLGVQSPFWVAGSAYDDGIAGWAPPYGWSRRVWGRACRWRSSSVSARR